MSPAKINGTTLPTVAATPAPVINMIDGVPMADSRNVAAMFGKRHNNVLRDVRGLLNFEDTPCRRHFRETTYVDPQNGQAYPHFLMDRDGFALLAMGFTGARATRWKLAYIEAFNAMEAELRRRQPPAIDVDDNATLRRLLLGKLDRIEVLETRVEEQAHDLAIAHERIEQAAPAVEAYEHLMDDTGTCCLADAARVVGAEQKPFFAWLRKAGYVFDKGDALLPRADLRKDGRFKVRLIPISKTKHVERTVVTRQGLVWLTHRWTAKRARDAREAAEARIQGVLSL